MNLRRLWMVAMSLPRTIWFNFRYLPFAQARKLPIWLAPNVRVKSMYRGGIQLQRARFNASHIGFHCADAIDCYGGHTIISVKPGGKWIVIDDLHIGRGAVIHVGKEGELSVGDNFAISGTTSIVCSKSITIGKDVQFSWNSLVMDSDAHRIFDENGEWMNCPEPVQIGNHVWIAANTTIMKRSVIGDNCVVAANSLVNRKLSEPNKILAGSPAKPVRTISDWQL